MLHYFLVTAGRVIHLMRRTRRSDRTPGGACQGYGGAGSKGSGAQQLCLLTDLRT